MKAEREGKKDPQVDKKPPDIKRKETKVKLK
jgi:hypothetical protein